MVGWDAAPQGCAVPESEQATRLSPAKTDLFLSLRVCDTSERSTVSQKVSKLYTPHTAYVYVHGKRFHLPFRVLVHVSVRLHRVFLDEEFDALVEGGGD